MGEMLQCTLDHLWHGVDDEGWLRRATDGDDRARDVLDAVVQTLEETMAEKMACGGCLAVFHVVEEIACISVVRFDNQRLDTPATPVHPGFPARRIVVGLPFCFACATSEDAISRLARQTIVHGVD